MTIILAAESKGYIVDVSADFVSISSLLRQMKTADCMACVFS